jgi:hypothetical protein
VGEYLYDRRRDPLSKQVTICPTGTHSISFLVMVDSGTSLTCTLQETTDDDAKAVTDFLYLEALG